MRALSFRITAVLLCALVVAGCAPPKATTNTTPQITTPPAATTPPVNTPPVTTPPVVTPPVTTPPVTTPPVVTPPATTPPVATPPAAVNTTVPTPNLTITSPVNGASLVQGNVTVTAQVINFNIVDKQGQANVAGEGHLHFYLDVDAPTAAGQPAVPASGVWAHVSGNTYTFANVTAGTHNISVQLINNDHTPVIPAVVARITVNVTSPVTTAVPTLTITSPANGASLVQGNITVTAQVTNFNIVDKQGQPIVTGEGHLHFYLDVDAPTTAGQPAVPASGVWAHVSGNTFTFANVTAGMHNISVQLVNNNHTPVIPAVVVKITVNVTTPVTTAVPTLVITSPANGANLVQGNITVTAQVTNFNIVDKQGQANVAGEGHLHFYLDVDAPTTAGQPAVPASGVWAHVSGNTFTFANVTAGIHNISVQLVNNNHTPVIPAVVVKITVNVTAAPNPPAQTPYTITISNFAFSSASITVPVGANVTWTNMDGYVHAVNGSGGSFDSGPLAPGASFSFVFRTPGTYTYICALHPYMTGTIVVQ